MKFFVDFSGTRELVEEVQSKQDLAEVGRRLWRELFVEVSTDEQLWQWEQRIPRFGCTCKQFYRSWKAKNPPTFPLSLEWKWMLKSAVNKKLGKPNLSWEEVFFRYRHLATEAGTPASQMQQ